MKYQLATLAMVVAMVTPALAQNGGSWTLLVQGTPFCGSLKTDRAGHPLEFVTTRGVVVSFAKYPTLAAPASLHRGGCSRAEVDDALDAEDAANPEAPDAATKAAQQEQKEIHRLLKEHCDRHPDEPGCKD